MVDRVIFYRVILCCVCVRGRGWAGGDGGGGVKIKRVLGEKSGATDRCSFLDSACTFCYVLLVGCSPRMGRVRF